MKPFNLQEAVEQGATVVTRNGCKVELLGYGTSGRPVRARYKLYGRWHETCYTIDGRYSFNGGTSGFDLMIQDYKAIKITPTRELPPSSETTDEIIRYFDKFKH